MTDSTSIMSAEEKAGRELIARKDFRKEAVWLPSLAVQHLNAGEVFIDGKTFTECLIEGPAIIAATNGTYFDGCNMGVATDPKTLLFKPLGPKMAGVIGMSDCRFINCRFVQVGFTGSDAFLADMETMLVGARSQTAGDQTS